MDQWRVLRAFTTSQVGGYQCRWSERCVAIERGHEVLCLESIDTSGRSEEVVLHPYRTWGNRGPTTMRVWIPVVEERHDR